MNEEFFTQLQSVVQFLQDNGFEKAAGAIIDQLETQNRNPEPQSDYDYADHQPCVEEEYRSKSAEPVLVSSRAASEAADEAREGQAEGPWAPGDAGTLTTRLSGSTRLYEDPDLDEYDGMDDLGYLRRCVSNQQEFVLRELEPQEASLDPPYFHHTASPSGSPGQYTNASSTSPLSAGSGSGSSSASLSSPGGMACKQQQLQPDVGAPLQLRSAGSGPCCAPTGDEAWDQGPEGIVLAEPVTTPTKDSRRSSASELKPSLSRVESLSNSFIDELESIDGAGDCGRLSEVGSTAGDLGTPPRRSSSSTAVAGTAAAAEQQEDDGCVIDLSPPSPPPDCAADAGIDLSNIFELGLRGSSRTSSVDVLYGSTRCWSETDSELGGGGGQDGGGSSGSGLSRLAWPAAPAAAGGAPGGGSSSSGGSQPPASFSGAGTAPAAAGGGLKPRSSLGSSGGSGSGVPVASIWQPMAPPSQLEEQQQEQALLELLQQQQQGQQPAQEQLPQQQQQEATQQGFAGLEAAPLAADVQQIHTSDSGTSSTAAPETPVSSSEAGAAAAAAAPAAGAGEAATAAAGEAAGTPPPPAAGAGGFGFSFPITPPSAVDAAVHEERAERVFSTWASNHSRSGLDAAGASDDEDTGSSKPLLRTVSSGSKAGTAAAQAAAAAEAATQPLQEEPDAYECSWEFPSTPVAAAAPPAAAAAAAAAAEPAAQQAPAAADDDGAAAGGSDPAPVEAAAAPADAGQQTKLSSPFSSSLVPPDLPTGWQSQLQQHKGSSSSGGGGIRRVGPSGSGSGSRPHSSAGGSGSRAAVAGRSGGSSSSRHKAAGGSSSRPHSAAASAGVPAAAGSPAAAAAAGGAGSGPRAVRGSPRSTVTEGRSAAGGSASLDALSGFSGLLAGAAAGDADGASTAGYSSSGELAAAPRYVVDEAGNPLYEYDAKYVEQRYEVFDLRIIHRRRRTGFEDSKEFPVRKNDLIAGRYQVMDFLGSAAFSQAVQALDTASGALVCLKIIKNNKDYFDQSLDEIKLLRYVNGADPEDEHHIVRLYDFFYYKEHLILVCELLRANLYEFQKYQRENGDEPYFTPPRIQAIAVQVLQSLAFLHSLGLVHSDLKPENILIKSYSRCEVKVIDLGSSCFVTDHLSSYVQSRSYRAPEVILGLPYGQKVDIWSLGCILAELATGYVLFQNDSLSTLLVRLEGILGPLPGWMVGQGRYAGRYYTRSRQIYERSKASGRYELLLPKHTSLRHRVPGADELFLDFLSYLLTPDPQQRPGAEEALQHPWLAHPYPPVEQIPD